MSTTTNAPRSGAARWLARLGDRLGEAMDAVASASDAMRCKREAERLLALSDAELATLGLTRDRVVQHAFRRYLGH
jgi:hypothetical protein